MTALHGKFVWYELMTTDDKAAEAFYRKAVGWGAQDAGMPGISYTLLSAGDTMVGGLIAMPQSVRDAGGRPGWIGYVAVDDVDANAAKASRIGGTIHRAPDDIPTVGRFSIVADPQGAMIALFKSATEGRFQPAKPGVPGHAGWHELFATDRERAFAFYAELFGWTKAEAFDMGAMGVYQLFATGGPPVGGMMTKPEAMPMPFWLYYFTVDRIDAAKARVEENGGQVVHGPAEVPGGSWIIQCIDPQGAMFALVAPRR
jgi:predicted enzyme related to lactoylglutathione lyase